MLRSINGVGINPEIVLKLLIACLEKLSSQLKESFTGLFVFLSEILRQISVKRPTCLNIIIVGLGQ